MNNTDIKNIACIGSGTIGTSWALAYAWHGYFVNVYDIGNDQLESAQKCMNSHLEALMNYNVITCETAETIKKRVSYTDDMAIALHDVQYVQESGPESYEIKARILTQIETLVPAHVIIATSTSGLLITEMAKHMTHPGRLIGGHPYNPPHLIPLVEIIKGEKSDPAAAQTAYNFYKGIGKEPVILNKEVSGFIGNRIQYALFREAMDLVANNVCTIEDIDKAVQFGPGMRWAILGPNMIYNLGSPSGLRAMFKNIGPSMEGTLSQMATWDKVPNAFLDKITDGLKEEMTNRPAEIGRTYEEITAYRDLMLIELLRLFKKI